MVDPIGFFITWPSYGTWLPGDSRGWVEHGQGWKQGDEERLKQSRLRMADNAFYLSVRQRELVKEQIHETCQYRNWILHAVNCRSNHVHVVVAASEVSPDKILRDLKAWTTRRLNRDSTVQRKKYWAERGSIRHLFKEEHLETAILYTIEGQNRVREGRCPR